MGYVGQTCMSVTRRCQHGKKYKPGTIIREAFDLYGEDGLVCIILEEGLTKEEANEREIFWIGYLGTLYPNGMNLEIGGKHSPKNVRSLEKYHITMKGQRLNRPDQSKRVQQFTKDGQFVKEYLSVSEAARQTKIDRRSISKCCDGIDKYKSAGNFVWKFA